MHGLFTRGYTGHLLFACVNTAQEVPLKRWSINDRLMPDQTSMNERKEF